MSGITKYLDCPWIERKSTGAPEASAVKTSVQTEGQASFSVQLNGKRRLCVECIGDGYCHRQSAPIVTDAELSNPEFIRDVRDFAFSLEVGPDSWLAFLAEEYREYPGRIVDGSGAEVFVELDNFEVSEEALFGVDSDLEREKARTRSWFRDFCCTPCPPEVRPRVRIEARERARAVATILRARNPAATRMWGVRAANNNEPQE